MPEIEQSIDLEGAIGAYPTCASCGSFAVMRDAWATWNAETGLWELSTIFDASFCVDCDSETSLTWVSGDVYRRHRIRQLNDQLRRGQPGPYDRVVMTAGVANQGEAFVAEVTATIASFVAFDPDNDPHGEHDFGAVTVREECLFFKIDYYNRSLDGHSPDPADAICTARVLTIMLVSEY